MWSMNCVLFGTTELTPRFVLSVFLRFTDIDYPFRIFKLFLNIYHRHISWTCLYTFRTWSQPCPDFAWQSELPGQYMEWKSFFRNRLLLKRNKDIKSEDSNFVDILITEISYCKKKNNKKNNKKQINEVKNESQIIIWHFIKTRHYVMLKKKVI
jgi:hypothetical protein